MDTFVLGNGNILVGIDEHARIREFFYPYVGLHNHVGGKPHHIGIWVDGQFSWIDNSNYWNKILRYKKETLVTDIVANSKRHGLSLHFNDLVDKKKNILLRKINVQNNLDKEREVRLFFHQFFAVNGNDAGDTAYYHPIEQSVVHYKGDRYFLMNACLDGKKESAVSSYSHGLAGIMGYEGTFRDAEDGVLGNNPIEHGAVDSTFSVNFKLKPGESREVSYWICVGKNLDEVCKLNKYTLKNQNKIVKETANYWFNWVNQTRFEFKGLGPEAVEEFKRSLMVINVHTDNHGAVIASCDSQSLHLRKDTYSYMWPRDGALIVRALDRAGYSDISQRFFKFCSKIISKDGYLFHKYLADGSIGSSWHPWMHEDHVQLPIQEDETAIVLFALMRHYQFCKDKKFVESLYKPLIVKAGDFVYNYVYENKLPIESYDLWEERLGIHTYTVCTVIAALEAAAFFEEQFGTKEKANKFKSRAHEVKDAMLEHMVDKETGCFVRRLYWEKGELKKDYTTDASTGFGLMKFGILPIDDYRVKATFDAFERDLKNPTEVGGYIRYPNDNYHRVDPSSKGSPWFICALWMADYHVAKAKNEEDLKPFYKILDWYLKYTFDTGITSEQVNPLTGEPLSVVPLTWSHAAYVSSVTKYLEKLDSLGLCEICNPNTQ